MAKKITFSGIMAALCLAVLYGANLIPTTTVFLFCFSTVFLAAIVIECGIASSVTAYVAVSLLSLLLLPNKMIALAFILFFGYYPALKYAIEKRGRLIVEWVLKLTAFNLFLVAGYFLFQFFFVSSMASIRIPLWGLILLAEVVFVIYDLALSMCIAFYNRRLAGKLKIK